MDFLSSLWLPIVLSAVLVFVASSVIHMALPFHKNDVKKLEKEDAVMEALRANGVAPGAYMFPGCRDMKETKSEEFKAKWEKGPVGWLTIVTPGGFNMGKCLAQWFAFNLIVSVFTGYVAWHALQAGADYLRVFQITGAAAFMAYALGQMHESIWKGVSWTVTFKFMFDGLVYALVTAGSFGAMWPGAAEGAPATPPLG